MTPLTPAAFLLLLCLPEAPPAAAAGDPTPTPWPPQFHATLVMDSHGNMSIADLWYDWPGGRNLHVIRYQLADDAPYFDNELNNGTSFFYTPARRSCRSAAVGVGILRPDWLLPGAVYLGRRDAGGFDCHVWAKADFITYYEDVKTKRPVKWVFYTGRIAYVMNFEVGAVLEDAAWQVPEYCFNKDGGTITEAADGHDDSFIPSYETPSAVMELCGRFLFPMQRLFPRWLARVLLLCALTWLHLPQHSRQGRPRPSSR